ncbi:restriction endonuclease subunit S [Escherichia coli]|uniref:restriction endonuclease subunit S n=1 Tax=Enterobacteriaceae TaxID=543 RepID=UPI000BDEC1A9|nr:MULTISPECIES: restriction endonuclease subunit S [Enterobacteriaceae]EFN8535986.1 restriction endonuclease subunit S [Escherichia coli O1]EFB5277048.1 restriction endonuclease subunit S [Escherichia coli]ELX6119269.1 restriction endonuclease subunit S [Escherichia coli]ULK07339.1 restriction endonuclease subunit S [Shigella dysenteriae]ULK12079.1 restriction endonuclease subunit S [Shigella dysenteriae]
MGSNYIEMRLEDCMDAIIDYRGKTPKKVDNGIPLITAKIIKNGRIQEVNEFIAINDYDDWMVRGLPLEGDVVLTTEAPLGEVAQLDARKVALAQRVITLRGKKGILENDYLLYLLQSSFVQNQLDGRASGSTVTGIKQSELREIILRLPPVSLQKSISHQLKCLDKKIDLNNKINKTLEQMSQTLFKSWFVDFDPVIDNALDAGNPIPEALQSRAELRQKVRNSTDFKPLPAEIRSLFPSEFEETELGWVPKDWLITSFNDLIELIGGGTPKTIVEEYWNGDIPWFSVVDAPNESDVYVLSTEKSITAEGLKNSSAKLLRKGTTIISARGTVGKCAMVAVPMAMNQSCYGVIGKNKISDEYVYFQLKNVVQTLQQMGHGSVFNTITRDTIKNIKVPFCNEELTNTYSTYVKKYFSKILNNNYQNIALTKLRDTLLPKLISGELSVEELPDLIQKTEAA